MVPALLLLGHGVLGALALPTVWLKAPWRARVLVGLSVVGAGLAVALVVFNGSLEEWRTARLTGVATLVGVAVAVAWLVVAATSARAGSSLACCLVGISAAALGLAATNQWSVPALLFWLCSSLAVAALAAQGRGGIWVWGVIFASDVALTAALIGRWTETSVWTLPSSLDGWPFYVLLVAAGLRAGIVPALGVWGLLGSRGAPAVPLLVGGAFALLPIALGGGGDPWAGAVLFVVAIGLTAVAIALRTLRERVAFAAAVPVAAFLGLAIVAPAGLVPAGIAALVAAGTAALWPGSAAESGRDRVIALTALPPLIGFVAAVTALGAAVERTVVAEDVVDKVPWTLALVLAPTAIAAVVALGVRWVPRFPVERGWVARVRRADGGALGLLAARMLLLFAMAALALPGDWLGIGAPFATWTERKAILFGAALVLAVGVGWWVYQRAAKTVAHAESPALDETPAAAEAPIEVGILPVPRAGTLPARLLTVVTLLLAIGVIAAVGWFTFEGLRLGFL